MTGKSKDAPIAVFGCITVIWQLLVTTPMWLVLIFGILHHVQPESWVWVLYWCYCPVLIFGVVMAGFVRTLLQSE